MSDTAHTVSQYLPVVRIERLAIARCACGSSHSSRSLLLAFSFSLFRNHHWYQFLWYQSFANTLVYWPSIYYLNFYSSRRALDRDRGTYTFARSCFRALVNSNFSRTVLNTLAHKCSFGEVQTTIKYIYIYLWSTTFTALTFETLSHTHTNYYYIIIRKQVIWLDFQSLSYEV